MITKIKVDGFKSLSDFELDLTPGLNILVRPQWVWENQYSSFF